ncbi:glycosyltransferase [Patescibacteria group bacterium]|nr:glycosyltransferase [Patescibacteria group bacterium]
MKIAIGLVVHNEANNIESLLTSIIKEQFNSPTEIKVFVYTDRPTDSTENIVKDLSNLYQNKIRHLRGRQNRGKVHGVNTILYHIKKNTYNYVVMMDGDIKIKHGALCTLVEFMEKNPNILGAKPMCIPIIKGNFLQRIRATVIKKKVIFSSKNKMYKILTGRLNITRGINTYPFIETGHLYEDIKLNLTIPYTQIDICTDSTIEYEYKSSLLNQFRYKRREGRAFGMLKENFPCLYNEQKRRLRFSTYFLTGGLGGYFTEFVSSLNAIESVVFTVGCLVNTLGFATGFIFNHLKNDRSVNTWIKQL